MNRVLKLAVSLLIVPTILVAGYSIPYSRHSESAIAASPTDWPMLQHDPQRTGYSPATANPPFATKWTWNTNQNTAVRIAGKAQPIVVAGKVYIGAFDGRLYALDQSTGAQSWSFATAGPIFHTAAFYNGNVYVGSDDGSVYAVDALSGSLKWKYGTGAGIWTSPLVVSNNATIYVGSRDSYFYALDANTGALRWRYKTGGPILNSAAYSSRGTVYFGSEDMYAYALDAASGALTWRARLSGQSFRGSWPVVSEKHGLVMFRTMPVYGFADTLNTQFPVLSQVRGQSFATELNAISTYLTNNPLQKTFYTLDATTGLEKYTLPILYTGGLGETPAPPVIDGTGDIAYVIWQSNEGYAFEGGAFYDFRALANIAAVDLGSGTLSHVEPNPAISPSNPWRNHFRLVSDETSVLSLGGTNLFVTMSQSVGAIDVGSRALSHVIHESEPSYDGVGYPSSQAVFKPPICLAYSSEVDPTTCTSTGGHLAPAWGPAVPAGGLLLWVSDGSALAAVSAQ